MRTRSIPWRDGCVQRRQVHEQGRLREVHHNRHHRHPGRGDCAHGHSRLFPAGVPRAPGRHGHHAAPGRGGDAALESDGGEPAAASEPVRDGQPEPPLARRLGQRAQEAAARVGAALPPHRPQGQAGDHLHQKRGERRGFEYCLLPRRGGAVHGHQERPDQGLRVHRKGSSGRCGDQRHGGAGAGQHRPAGCEASHGGQGGVVQEVRRSGRLRHRAQAAGP
mmetsp:Transcript_105/g.191  ORF Transcript_105/g.191 Transcript_105/m.191 type:complete len:221 (-) Transcript_105:1554-2216(-)